MAATMNKSNSNNSIIMIEEIVAKLINELNDSNESSSNDDNANSEVLLVNSEQKSPLKFLETLLQLEPAKSDNGGKASMTNEQFLLHDFSPFSNKFYQYLNELLTEGYRYLYNVPNSTILSSQGKQAIAGGSMELDFEYSLPRHQINTRITRIFVTLLRHADEYYSFEKLFTSRKNDFLTIFIEYLSKLPQFHSYIYKLEQMARTASSSSTVAQRAESMNQATSFSMRLQSEFKAHLEQLEYCLGELYTRSNATGRALLRLKMGRLLHQYATTSTTSTTSSHYTENTMASGIELVLYVLLRITKAFSSTDTDDDDAPHENDYDNNVHTRLLLDILMPLHHTNAMILWRDQNPILSLYHEPLVLNLVELLQRYPQHLDKVLQLLCTPPIWPNEKQFQVNTSKVVLLLHEMDTLFKIKPSSNITKIIVKESTLLLVISKLSVCVQGDNSRTAEQALQFWKNNEFELHLKTFSKSTMKPLLKMLCRNFHKSWNPTVNKMLKLVLEKVLTYDEALFWDSANDLFSKNVIAQAPPKPIVAPTPAKKASPLPHRKITLQDTMGDWKPPTTYRGNSAAPPPLTVTGVAPWAMNKNTSNQQQPPLTVTGVAPWAMNKNTSNQQKVPTHSTSNNTQQSTSTTISGSERVKKYIESLVPSSSTSTSGTNSSSKQDWSKIQLAETPTLLPQLKFHDLVFGHELGQGAFGQVMYAKRIERSVTRSYWQEFAVKIVSMKTIVQMGYFQSVAREIKILSSFSHPNISRLISSFHFKTGVYLVVEYASKGDLHTAIQKLGGRLSPTHTQFVMGEVLAALISIHDKGFVYGDLKPENILICESNHIKLTDFGGCRPVEPTTKEWLNNCENVLKDMRDGDWRDSEKEIEIDFSEIHQENEEDDRIEGTTAYLPPEVVMGNVPTYHADSWAYGCCLYQCLTGRPPLLQDTDESTRQRIVGFDLSSSNADDNDLFTKPFQKIIESKHVVKNALDLIRTCLQVIPNERPTLNSVAQHSLFGDVDVLALYKKDAIPFHFDANSDADSSKWTRRQFSAIWAPQPKSYSVGTDSFKSNTNDVVDKSVFRKIVITEGDEKTESFLVIKKKSSLFNLPPILGIVEERKSSN